MITNKAKAPFLAQPLLIMSHEDENQKTTRSMDMAITGIEPSQLDLSSLMTQIESSGVLDSSKSSSASSADSSEKLGKLDFSSLIMKALDTDGDGKISAEESKAAMEKAKDALSSLNTMDSKIWAHQAQGQLASRIVGDLDVNKDGSLSMTETGLIADDFNKLDTNNDGKLAAKELNAEIKQSARSSSDSEAKSSEYARILGKLGQNAWASNIRASLSGAAA